MDKIDDILEGIDGKLFRVAEEEFPSSCEGCYFEHGDCMGSIVGRTTIGCKTPIGRNKGNWVLKDVTYCSSEEAKDISRGLDFLTIKTLDDGYDDPYEIVSVSWRQVAKLVDRVRKEQACKK